MILCILLSSNKGNSNSGIRNEGIRSVHNLAAALINPVLINRWSFSLKQKRLRQAGDNHRACQATIKVPARAKSIKCGLNRVGKEHCSVFGERLFSSVFCSVFNSEHVRHFVRLLFVFGVRGLLCSCSCSDCLFMFSSVFRSYSHADVDCQC